MSYYFLDSSALAKRYLAETGSTWVAALTDLTAGNTIVAAEITRIEVAAALAARHRAPQGITFAERDRLLTLLLQHFEVEYTIASLHPAVFDQAVRLTQSYRLRGYDAVQLATALDINAIAVTAALPGLVFVAADDDSLAAARAEGMVAENPNLH